MRAAVAGIVHESSTFAAAHGAMVGLADFAVHTGEDLIGEFAGTNTVVGGYLTACRDAGVTVIPALHARAEPAAVVDPDAYADLRDRLLASLRPGWDLLLLDLHGAGVIAPTDSLEADLLREVRAAYGLDRLVAVTLDLHGNLPPEVCELADVVVGFHHYPHVDMAARARHAATVAVGCRLGRRGVHSHLRRLPMVLPPSPTDEGAALRLRSLAAAAEREPGVLACTAFHGFPYADTPQAGSSVVTVTAGDMALGAAVNDRMAGWLWRHREEFLPDTIDTRAAVAQAVHAPVVIGDASDNPGGGGTGDGTYLLRAILDAGVRACFATLHDPIAVRRTLEAGVGATVEVRLGGRNGAMSGAPVTARVLVRAVTDGRVVQQSVRRGKRLDFGPCAWLRVGALDLVVATRRAQVFDPAILLLHGIDPAAYPLVAVKSAYHFRSGFAYLNRRLLSADSLGLTTRRVELLGPRSRSDHLWPMSDPSAGPRDRAGPGGEPGQCWRGGERVPTSGPCSTLSHAEVPDD